MQTISKAGEKCVAARQHHGPKERGTEINITRLSTVKDQLWQAHKVFLLWCWVLQEVLGVEHNLGHLESVSSKVGVISIRQLKGLLWSGINVSIHRLKYIDRLVSIGSITLLWMKRGRIFDTSKIPYCSLYVDSATWQTDSL